MRSGTRGGGNSRLRSLSGESTEWLDSTVPRRARVGRAGRSACGRSCRRPGRRRSSAARPPRRRARPKGRCRAGSGGGQRAARRARRGVGHRRALPGRGLKPDGQPRAGRPTVLTSRYSSKPSTPFSAAATAPSMSSAEASAVTPMTCSVGRVEVVERRPRGRAHRLTAHEHAGLAQAGHHRLSHRWTR